MRNQRKYAKNVTMCFLQNPSLKKRGRTGDGVHNNKVVKNHITGTPARTKPTRKFGTMIQPANQSKDSVEERVEALPTRAQSVSEARSPEPMMVTGGLAKICSVM